MIDPKKSLFKWGPIDGMPLYIHAFNKAFVNMYGRMGYRINDLFNYFKDGKVTIVLEDEKLRECAIPPFKNIVMDDDKVRKYFELWELTVKRLRAFEEVVNHGLSHMEDDKLLLLFKEWYKAHLDFWDYGFLPELSNWGGEKLLIDALEGKENFSEILEALSAPNKLSFFQNEEIDFLSIKLVEDENMHKILIENHAKKYYWLNNSYGHTEILDFTYFSDKLSKVTKEEARKKVREIGYLPENVKDRKNEIIKKYKIDFETVKIGERIGYCIWWQDLRKKYIFIANHINSVFAEEIASRWDIDFNNLLYYTEEDLINLFEKNKEIDITKRIKSFMMLYEDDSLKYLEGEEADKYAEPYFNYEIDEKQTEVKGLVVSKGDLVKGKAKIIHTPKEISHFNEGDILIAAMTSPDFIVAMRKASAIVTDEGGVTSHAAIVSRELKIPCIVGTKIATKLFKNDDDLEVDTKAGVVRKING